MSVNSTGSPDSLAIRYFRFNRNVLVSVSVRVGTLASGLVAAAVLARGLGITMYGLWALATTFMSYLALIDLGVSGGLIKLAGQAGARQDRSAVSNYTAVAAGFYTVIGLTIIGLVVLLQGVLVRALAVPSGLRPEAGLLFTTATTLLMVNNLVAVYQGTVMSAEAIHLTSILSLVTAAGNLAAAVTLEAALNLGAEAVLLGMLVAAILTLVLSVILYGVVCKPVHWLPQRITRATLRAMVSFSAGIQLSNVASIVNSSLDKFVLSAFVGLSATAMFDLGGRPSLLTSSIAWLIATAAYPTLVRVASDNLQSRQLFSRFETYLQVAGCGLAGILVALARPFVDLWLGTQFESVVLILQVLAIARCGLVLTNIATVAHWAKGMTRDTIVFAVARLALHFACSLALVWKFGLPGALIGVMVSFTIPSAWFVHRTGKVLGVPMRPWMVGLVKIVVVTCIATVLALAASAAMDRIPLAAIPRWILEGMVGSLLYVLVFLVLLVVLKIVSKDSVVSIARALRHRKGGAHPA